MNTGTPSSPSTSSAPEVVDRAGFEAELDALRVREKAHTHDGDAIAAARRRLPMVEVDPTLQLIGPAGPVTLLDTFEGRRQLIAYYFMWNPGRPAPEQCEGCTFYTSQVVGLSHLHSRDITYAVFCQGRTVATDVADAQESYAEAVRYRDFMGWTMPWYSAQPCLDELLVGRELGLFRRLALPAGRPGVYALMDLTVYGRQEEWEDSPAGWPQDRTNLRTETGAPDWREVTRWPGGRPIAQWPRLEAGHSDDLGAVTTQPGGGPGHCH